MKKSLKALSELYLESIHLQDRNFGGLKNEVTMLLETLIYSMQTHLIIPKLDLKKEIKNFIKEQKEYLHRNFEHNEKDLYRFFNLYDLYFAYNWMYQPEKELYISRFRISRFRNFHCHKDIISNEVFSLAVEFIDSLFINKLNPHKFHNYYDDYVEITLNHITSLTDFIDFQFEEFFHSVAQEFITFIKYTSKDELDIPEKSEESVESIKL